MAVTSGFFDSLNGDRTYSAGQFSALFDNLITDGVFVNVGTAFEVKANGQNNITVGIGRAWFNSIWLYNDAIYPMVAQDPEVLLNRIDAIVIEINHNEAVRSGQIRWVYGSPSMNPVRPELTNTDTVHQYPLAYVYRKAGDSMVIQADITNMIGTSSCPYVTGILETQNIDKIVAQWESQFYNWFDNLEASLSGDVAANLANQVLDLQSRFQTLARDKAVYEELQDSNGVTIQDSDGSDILGRTSLGGENVIINYPVSGGQDEGENFKIGDTLTTMRTDLDNTWLLCNGAKLNRVEYEELSSVVGVPPTSEWVFSDSGTNIQGNGTSNILVYDNQYYLVVYLSNTYTISLIRSSDLVTWTTLSSMSLSDDARDLRLRYGNGQFVFSYELDSSFHYRYSASITTPIGNWTAGSKSNFMPTNVKFLNGQFIAVGYMVGGSFSRSYAYYGASMASLTGTYLDGSAPFGSIDNWAYDITYGSGYYCIIYRDNNNISYASFSQTLSLASNNFSQMQFVVDSTSIDYWNGYFWVITGRTSRDYKFTIACTNDPNGAWSIRENIPGYVPDTSELAYYNGYYMLPVGYPMDTTSNGVTVVFFKELEDLVSAQIYTSNDMSFYPYTIIEQGGYYNLAFLGYRSSLCPLRSLKMSTSDLTLPSIASDDGRTYTYIKAKE